MDKISLTELRTNIYQIIDEVIRTGEPCMIKRGEHTVYITPEIKKARAAGKQAKPEGLMAKLAKMPKRKLWDGTDEELLNFKVWDEEAWERKWDERLKGDE